MQKSSRLMAIVFTLILMVCGGLLFWANNSVKTNQAYLTVLKSNRVLTREAAAKLKAGDRVVLDARVASENTLAYPNANLVSGCFYIYDRGDNIWELEDDKFPLKLLVSYDFQDKLIVTDPEPCPAGSNRVRHDNGNQRWEGLGPQTPITVVGIYTGQENGLPVVQAEVMHAGSPIDFLRTTKNRIGFSRTFSGFFLGISAFVLLIFGLIKKFKR